MVLTLAPLSLGCVMAGVRLPSSRPLSEEDWGSVGFTLPFKVQRTRHMGHLRLFVPVSVMGSSSTGEDTVNVEELHVGVNWVIYGKGDDVSRGTIAWAGAGIGYGRIDWEGSPARMDSTFETYVCAGWWWLRKPHPFGLELKYIMGADVDLGGQASSLDGLQIMLVF